MRTEIRNKAASVCKITGTIMLVLVILLCLPVTVPRAAGFQIYSVVSGSMEPEIPVGSLIYVKPGAPEEIKEKEVIAFYGAADGAVITHRVVENRVVSGEFITKGDANEENDIMPVSYDDLIGKVVLSIRKLGMAMEVLTTTAGKTAAAGLIGLSFVLYAGAAVLQKDNDADVGKD